MAGKSFLRFSENYQTLTKLLTPQATDHQSTQKDAGQEAQLATLPTAPAPLLLRALRLSTQQPHTCVK